MPRYAFTCEACGAFEVWRPAANAGVALACPGCGRPARRRYTAPGLARLPAALRAAREREERSRHAPEVVTAKTGSAMPAHAPGAPWAHRH